MRVWIKDGKTRYTEDDYRNIVKASLKEGDRITFDTKDGEAGASNDSRYIKLTIEQFCRHFVLFRDKYGCNHTLKYSEVYNAM